MRRTYVQSEAIHSVGYDPDTCTLEVKFTSDEVYQYLEVPAETHRAFMQTASKGQYFQEHIRDHFRYTKL